MTPSLPPIHEIWVYLSGSPLLALTLTLAAWQLGTVLYERSGRNPLVNPVAIAVAAVAAAILAIDMPYPTYFEGAQFVHFLLGPATVALAIPLHRNWPVVRRAFLPIAAALVAGAFTAVISAVGIAWAFGAPFEVLASLAPKSVTAAIAMGISDGLGGNPSLTATLVISTGTLGAIMVTPLMNALKLTDYRARGFAAGVASHGIGTARAFQVDPVAGTFAGIALGLNGLITALIVPVLVSWLR
jgi:predicted murein hydrolase (TIGR00659 family)